MDDGFWQRRLSRRRMLAGAATTAAVGGAGLFLPQRLIARTSPSRTTPVVAEDIVHSPNDLARGDLHALRWSESQGRPALQAAGVTEGVYTSPIIKTRLPCTHVGLHWREQGVPGSVRFEVRSMGDSGRWSQWRSVYVDSMPEETSRAETFGALVWTGGADRIQYRAHFSGDTPSGIEQVSVTALTVAPVEALARSPTPTRTPKAAATPRATSDAWALNPPFDDNELITREEWGAPEGYRFEGPKETWPRMYVPTKKLIVHHTATLSNGDPANPYPNYTPDQAYQDVHAIYYYHAITKGWGDIGYNALIDRFGRIFEGRRGRDVGPNGGRDIISADVVAGHALYCNEGAAGVSLIGNFDENAFGNQEEGAMIPVLLDFLTWSCRRHYIHPAGISDFLMVDLRTIGNLPNIAGHCDTSQTACPGRYAYAKLPEWREKVGQRIAGTARTAPSAQITQVPSSSDIERGRASFAWKSPDLSGAEFSYYLEGWLDYLDTDEVYYITGFTADKRPDWSSFNDERSATLDLPEPGRYTFHVRAKDPSSRNEGAFETNVTFISYTTPPTTRRIGVPGITKN